MLRKPARMAKKIVSPEERKYREEQHNKRFGRGAGSLRLPSGPEEDFVKQIFVHDQELAKGFETPKTTAKELVREQLRAGESIEDLINYYNEEIEEMRKGRTECLKNRDTVGARDWSDEIAEYQELIRQIKILTGKARRKK